MAHSLLQSKPPEAGVSTSRSLCFPRGQVGLGGRSPRPLPFSLVDLVSRRSTGPACPDPKPLGRRALLSSDEHIHPPNLGSRVCLPRKLSHQTVCRLPPFPPAVLQQCVCCRVCLPRKTGPPTSLSLARLVGWHSLCSVRACGTRFKVGGPNAISS